MCSDPRNDRRHDEDCFDDRPRCGICDRLVTPANFGAWDAHDVFCVACETAAEASGVAANDLPTDEEYHAPMTGVEASRLAVEVALGGANLLNGGGGHPDDEAEDETVEVPAETMAELVHGRRGAAA